MYKFFLVLALSASVSLLAGPDIRAKTLELPRQVEPVAQVDEELKKLKDIISITKKNLENQSKLFGMIEEYRKIQSQYLQNAQDKELTYQMVMKAHTIFLKIKDLHLTHAFEQDFLSELAFFSKMAEKWNSPQSTS